MPNHIHLILEVEKANLVRFKRDFLKFTAKEIRSLMELSNDPLWYKMRPKTSDRENQFWEIKPKVLPVASPNLYAQKEVYIHNNPLQKHWKLANKPEEYYWSSAKSYKINESQFEFLTLINLW